MPCTELDEFIKQCIADGVSTCSEITLKWMEHIGMRYTEWDYHHRLQQTNRHMKTMEKYGIVRYTGRTVSMSDRSKIWELVQ